MRKIIFMTLIILNIFTLKVSSLEKSVEIVPSKSSPYVGEEISLNLNINSLSDLYGFEIELVYDGDMLQPTNSEVVVGELLKDNRHFIAINKIENDRIRFMGTLLGDEQNLNAKGSLFKVNVKTLKEGQVKVNVNTLKLLDVNGSLINVTSNSDLVEIKPNISSDSSRKTSPVKDDINIQGPKETVDKIKIEKIIIHNTDEDLTAHSDGYEITSDKSLSSPIAITIPYRGDTKDINLGIYYFHEGRKKWLYLGGKVDSVNSTVTVTVDHLTKFAVFSCNKEDLPDINGHWCEEFVKRLYMMNFISGYDDGLFYPEKTISRGKMAVLLSKALDISPSGTTNFTDEDLFPSWAKESIYAVSQAGLFRGYEDGSFKSQKSISRGELMSVIGKLLPYEDCDMDYKDADEIPSWALEGIKNCTSHGIVKGDQGFIRSQDEITRGEAAVVIYNLLRELKI